MVATGIGVLARRAGSLSDSGAIAAALIGAASVAAGWAWGALLVVYFAVTVLLSRLGRSTKEARTASIVAKGGRRDGVQVVANGGLFALLALGTLPLSAPSASLAALAAGGALAASTADTWATEIGTLAGGTPRSLLTLQAVPVGTSGGVSVAGTLAMISGAWFIALLAVWLGVVAGALAIAAGGVTGALTDSLLGATVQARRWCEACERATERRVHDCGAPTRAAGGVAWMDNDVVNFLATCAGAVGAAGVAIIAAWPR